MRKHIVSIESGTGITNLANGTYQVEATVLGYDKESILPSSITVEEKTTSLNFTISAKGTLTIHVTDTSSSTGKAIVGARFIRTDSSGTVTIQEIETSSDGNATFENVPFDSTNSKVTIYYKQITSDKEHTFDDTLKSIIMTKESETVEVLNEIAPIRTFTLTDASFPNIVITE